MTARVKTIRAIEPNVGTRKAFEKKLSAFSRSFLREAMGEIVTELLNEGLLVPEASDALPKLTARERRIFDKVDAGLAQGVSPEMLREKIRSISAVKIARWLVWSDKKAKDISYWFCRSAARDVTLSQRRALAAAGISQDWLKAKFDVPIVRGQYISRRAAEQLPHFVEEATTLITKMMGADLARLQDVLAEGLSSGADLAAVRRTLETSQGFDAARAQRVALDQSVKINQAVQRANAQAIGITEGIWVHVPGKYSSRQSHIAMNGKRFKLSEGLYDSEEGRNVQCGELPFCRCVYKSIIPPDLLKTT